MGSDDKILQQVAVDRARAKAKKMADKNPLLKKLVEVFDLRIDIKAEMKDQKEEKEKV